MNWRLILRGFILVPCLFVLAGAQVSSSQPVSYASVSEVNSLLGQLQEASKSTQNDLAGLRIDKWKTDSGIKQQNQNNVDSIQRNLKDALPTMMTELQASPESLPATFKVYRNLDALYDVFTGVVESAAAFGSRGEVHSLGSDLDALEKVRRSFADRMENLAGAKETELTRLRTEVQKTEAAHPAPKKIVVIDDDAPAPKPAHKKASPRKTTPPKSAPDSK